MREAEALYFRFLELRLQIFEQAKIEDRSNPQANELTEIRSHGIDSK